MQVLMFQVLALNQSGEIHSDEGLMPEIKCQCLHFFVVVKLLYQLR